MINLNKHFVGPQIVNAYHLLILGSIFQAPLEN